MWIRSEASHRGAPLAMHFFILKCGSPPGSNAHLDAHGEADAEAVQEDGHYGVARPQRR